MPLKYIDNTIKVKIDLNNKVPIFMRFFLEEVHKQADPITPKKLGRLRQGVRKTVTGNNGKIEWIKEYAAAQEVGTTRGYPIQNYSTAGTGKNYAQRGVVKALKNSDDVLRKARII